MGSQCFRYHVGCAHGSLDISKGFTNGQIFEDLLRVFCVVGGGRQSIKNEKSELQLVSPSGECQYGPN